jgi:ribonuclease HII
VGRTPKIPPWTGPHLVGIDENGMGPRLGPLVVTSILAHVDERGAELATKKPKGGLAKRIGDSKKLVAFEDSALGEAWGRAILARMQGTAATPRELLVGIGLDAEDALRAPCPGHHHDLCWSDEAEPFSSTDDAVAACTKDLGKLDARGFRVVSVRVAIVCTRRLNEAVTRGLSRFDVDLHTMERLTLAARDQVGADVHALCGKVGGFDFYADRFGPLAGRLHTTLVEGRACSAYQLPGVGRLAFVRDADENHLIVGLASLVGKWARDHLMRRVIRWHRTRTSDELPDASGYHDPTTTTFVKKTALLRKKLRVETDCFERAALGRMEAISAASPSPSPPETPSPSPSPPAPELPTQATLSSS